MSYNVLSSLVYTLQNFEIRTLIVLIQTVNRRLSKEFLFGDQRLSESTTLLMCAQKIWLGVCQVDDSNEFLSGPLCLVTD